MYDVYSCGFDGVIVRPKRAHKQEIHIFASDFEGPRGARARQPNEQRSGPGHFWVTFGSVWGEFCCLWVTLRHLMVTLQSLWSHFWYMKAQFKETLISPTDFNDFIKLLGEVLVDLGLLWDHFWHLKVAWGPL